MPYREEAGGAHAATPRDHSVFPPAALALAHGVSRPALVDTSLVFFRSLLYASRAFVFNSRGMTAMAESVSFFGSVRRFFRDYLLVMETRGSFGQLVQQATEDAALRQRLLRSPKQV